MKAIYTIPEIRMREFIFKPVLGNEYPVSPLPKNTIKIWDKIYLALDRKKTVIGLVVVGACNLVAIFYPPIKGVQYLGWAIMGGGIFHKVGKFFNKNTSGETINFKELDWKKIIELIIELLKQILKLKKKE